MPGASLASNERLRQRYLELTKGGYLGGSTRLYELVRLAWASFEVESPDRQIVCFTLASLLDSVAKREEINAPITAEYGAELHRILGQPIIQALDLLTDRDTAQAPAEAASRLANAYADARPLLLNPDMIE